MQNAKPEYEHLNILKKKPVNIRLYDCNMPDRSLGGEVTSPFILEPSSTRFHPDGLFSEIIFGEVGSSQRLTQFGYIKLNTRVLNPMIFVDITRSKRLYKEIMEGKTFVKFDKKLGDFVPCKLDDEGASTGYAYFANNFHLINWDNLNQKSLTVQDKVKLIKKNPDLLFIDKMLVIPAELREYRIENGRGISDDINNLYLTLLNLARTDKDRVDKNSPIYDALRYRIQLKVIEISNYIKNILKDEGYLEAKFGSRSVAWATRNVLSPSTVQTYDLRNPSNLRCDETAVPLFQAAKAFQLLVVNAMRSIFFAPLMSTESVQVAAINRKTLNLEYIEVSEKEKQRFLSDEGVGDILNLFKNKEYRKNHLKIYDVNSVSYFLYLVYDDDDKIYITRNKNELEQHFTTKLQKPINPNKIRPLTIIELIYIATYGTTYNKHVINTRYPVTWLDSTYPSKVKVLATTPSRKVTLELVWEPDYQLMGINTPKKLVLGEYPILDGEFIDSVKIHPSRLAALGADHDGDQINTTGLMSEEANKELDNYINSPHYYIDTNGQLTTQSGGSYVVEMTLYNMSYAIDK